MLPRWRSCIRTTEPMHCTCASTSTPLSAKRGKTVMHPNDPSLKPFVEGAADSHLPIQNLPFGIFSTNTDPAPRVGVAIGDQILDLAVLEDTGLLIADPTGGRVFSWPSLNGFIALGQAVWRETRMSVSELLRHDSPRLRDDQDLRARALPPMAEASLHLPVEIGGYTDFYSSKEHATNVGMMFRDPKNALLPNWLPLPVGYNGRASSVVVSGTPVRRVNGQTKALTAESPSFGPSAKLDIELEAPFIVGGANRLGEPIPVGEAE